MLVLVLTQSNPNPSKSSALSFIPLAALPRLAAVTPAEYRNTSLHSPRQVTCIALHCLAVTRSAQEYIRNTPVNTYRTHTHAHTSSSPRPFRAAAANQPPLPPPPTSALRAALPCPTSAASCNRNTHSLLAARRNHHPMLRNHLRLFPNPPADAPSPTGIGFGHAACLAT